MKLRKIITIITIIFLFCNTICLAKVETEKYNPGQITSSDYGKVFELGKTITGALTTVGIVIAVVGMIIIGVKYMMGSVEEKADYKKAMIPYLVGCIFLFCTATIVSLIYNIRIQ